MSTKPDTTERTPSDAAPVRPSGTDDSQVSKLAVELRTLLGLRTRTSARDRPLPTLTSLLSPSDRKDPDTRFAAITTLIEAGVSAMPDADHAAAAEALLGSGPGRWRPLTTRGLEAAAPFGCGWDAYRRRRRSTGTSLLEETVDLLAHTLVDITAPTSDETIAAAPEPQVLVEPQSGPLVTIGPAADRTAVQVSPPVPVAAESPAPSIEAPPRSRRRLFMAAAILVVLLIIAGAALVGALLTGDESTELSCGSLDRQVGAVPEGAEADLAAWSDPFKDFVAAERLGDRTRCASHIARWEHGAIQRVGVGDSATITALVGSEVAGEMVVVHLTWAELRAFARATDPNGPDGGSQLGETMGPVLGRRDGPGGERVVEFLEGSFVTAANDAPTFAIVGAWRDIWNESGGLEGGLGLPLTDRQLDTATRELFQQFERGTITTAPDGQIQVVVDQTHYAEALPADPHNVVLVGNTGEWWYVDAEGVRHYVATADDKTCLEWRMGVPIVRGLPIASIATLPAGDQFLCR